MIPQFLGLRTPYKQIYPRTILEKPYIYLLTFSFAIWYHILGVFPFIFHPVVLFIKGLVFSNGWSISYFVIRVRILGSQKPLIVVKRVEILGDPFESDCKNGSPLLKQVGIVNSPTCQKATYIKIFQTFIDCGDVSIYEQNVFELDVKQKLDLNIFQLTTFSYMY